MPDCGHSAHYADEELPGEVTYPTRRLSFDPGVLSMASHTCARVTCYLRIQSSKGSEDPFVCTLG